MKNRENLVRDKFGNLIKANYLKDGLYTLVDSEDNKQFKVLICKNLKIVKIFSDCRTLKSIDRPLKALSGSDNLILTESFDDVNFGIYKHNNHLYIASELKYLILRNRIEYLITDFVELPTEITTLIRDLTKVVDEQIK